MYQISEDSVSVLVVQNGTFAKNGMLAALFEK
jgi:hypothetical protein